MSKYFLAVAMIALFASGCSQRYNAMNAPTKQDPSVIRTDFSSDEKWTHVCDLIAAPQKDAGTDFYAYVWYVNEEKYRDKKPCDLVHSLPSSYPEFFCFVVDRECIENSEHPVLVIGFYPSDNKSYDRPPRDTPPKDIATFRALPSQIQGIQNNLSIGNMDFEEFKDSADDDGVFRGFR